MSRELFAVVEQILDDGHMSTETLAQLRAAYEATTPQGEPVKYEFRMRPDWVDRVQWSEWKECTEAVARDYWRYSAGDWIYEARALYTASPPAAPSVPASQWIACSERMPDVGTQCLVWVTGQGGFCDIDIWDEQHEDPLGMGGPTVAIGVYWNSNDPDDITHWMPLPEAPSDKEAK